MARTLRIEYPGAIYHITSRGNAKNNIFYKDIDRNHFLSILKKIINRYNWICHSYCLMSNHYHLLIETQEANLSQGMRELNGIYALIFNKINDRVGHLFQGRYKGIIVERESYLLELCRYIVLNPVRAKIIKRPEDYPWSSYRATIGLQPALPFLTTDWILNQFGKNTLIAQKKYIEFVNAGIHADNPLNNLHRQTILGKEEFIIELENSFKDLLS